MKKVLYIISGFILFASISFASSITVTKPANEAVWAKSEAHVVEWRTDGEMHAKVKIRLYNGNSTIKIKEITNDTPTNDKRFRCPVNFFNDIPDGTYTIRIKTLDNNVWDDSAPFFLRVPPTIDIRIEEAESPSNNNSTTPFRPPGQHLNPPGLKNRINLKLPSIVINYPPKNHKWKLRLGNTALPFPIHVMWEKTGTGTQGRRVRILLQRRSPRLQTTLIAQNTANNGLFRGEIPRNLMTNVYTIIIKTLDGKIRAESEDFFIINAKDDPDTRR